MDAPRPPQSFELTLGFLREQAYLSKKELVRSTDETIAMKRTVPRATLWESTTSSKESLTKP
jgi:hypothetical protein